MRIFIPPELEMVKYVYVVITIMNDVLWKGRDGDFCPKKDADLIFR